MSADGSAHTWITRRSARWSMPVCLQPRAVWPCRIIQADNKRPVPQSRLGCRLRPNGNYQLEIAVDESSGEPQSVSFVGIATRRSDVQQQRLTQDGQALCRYDFQLARDDDGLRLPCWWWSRLERLVVRLEYGDGRDDYEHTFWLVVTPLRVWALLALVSSAILYGLVPWLSRTVLQYGDLPVVWSHVLEVLSRYDVWLGLMAVIVGLWLAVVVSDRMQLWLRGLRLRNALRREVRHYTRLAAVPQDGGFR